MKLLTKLLAGTGFAALTLMAADPWLGTWNMNVAKSKFNPGPAPKSVTSVYGQDGDWVVVKSEATDADGKSTTRSNRYKRDGNEYPYDGPNGKGTISVKKIDDYTAEAVTKFAGGHSITTRTVISKDGKTRTQTSRGVNARGQKVNTVVIFEKQ